MFKRIFSIFLCVSRSIDKPNLSVILMRRRPLSFSKNTVRLKRYVLEIYAETAKNPESVSVTFAPLLPAPVSSQP